MCVQVLFATCHDEEPLQEIRAEAGKVLSFETTAAGTVAWSDGADATASAANNGAGGAGRPKLKIDIPKWCAAHPRRCAHCYDTLPADRV